MLSRQAVKNALMIEKELVKYSVIYQESIYEWNKKNRNNFQYLYGTMKIILIDKLGEQKNVLKGIFEL